MFKRDPHQKELVWIARLSNIGILLIAIWIMANLNSIQTAWHLSLLFGSGLGVVLILRWIWHRINVWSEITAGVVSIILAPCLLYFFPDMQEGMRLILMTVGSTAGFLLVTWLTPPEPTETLKRFYARVKPPGFWTKIAILTQDNPNDCQIRFRKALFATILASLSVFGFILGLGQMMTHKMLGESSWLPLGITVFSGALIPIWWKLGFSKDS